MLLEKEKLFVAISHFFLSNFLILSAVKPVMHTLFPTCRPIPTRMPQTFLENIVANGGIQISHNEHISPFVTNVLISNLTSIFSFTKNFHNLNLMFSKYSAAYVLYVGKGVTSLRIRNM